MICLDSSFKNCFAYLQATESEAGDMDLSGLPEKAVDSEDEDDEEDIQRASDLLMSRDIVWDCLEKDLIHRTQEDIGEYGSRQMATQAQEASRKFINLHCVNMSIYWKSVGKSQFYFMPL